MKDRLESIKRIKLISNVTILLMIILSLKLGYLTLIKGQHYREISDSLSIKDVYVTAPRGEIRDRNGILLAGNQPIFTLQIVKDEFKSLDTEEKNEKIKELVYILEKNGEKTIEEFPIKLNQFVHKDENNLIGKETSAFESVIEIVVENYLLEDIIDKYYESDSGYKYFPIQNIINSLEYNSIDVPIQYKINQSSSIDIEFSEDYNISRWKRDYYIEEDLDPKESLLRLIDNDKTIIRKLLDHPIPRYMIFQTMVQNNLVENLDLYSVSISYLDEYKAMKKNLMSKYPSINMETTAINDLKIILESEGLDSLIIDLKDSDFKPTDILNQVFKGTEYEKQFKLIVEFGKKKYIYKGNEDLPESQVIAEITQALISEKKVEDLLDIDGVPALAQNVLVKKGINTGISITGEIEYTYLKQLESFIEYYKIEDINDINQSLESIKTRYNLEKDISVYELVGILNFYEQLNKPGQLSYMPINYSYALKDHTVAEIGEKLSDFDGFNISVEPIRSYPKGSSAAHILGYMGKISQESEIENYIEKLGYMPDTIIGKTGIEEAYEKSLYGEDGYKKIQVDSRGNTSSVIEDIKPIPGDNIYLSIDYNLQRRAELALEGILRNIREGSTVKSSWGDFPVVQSSSGPYSRATSGAAVVVDIETGEVLTMASFPSYDPNLFATGITSADWNNLRPDNEDNPLAPRPLLNVATQTAIQPGSTYKIITGITAVEKGLDPKMKLNSQGFVKIGDTEFGCRIWNQQGGVHGPTDLQEAIKVSCNYYFYSLAMGENQRTGEKLPIKIAIEDISSMSERFGLGSDTGLEINVPKEATQGVPSPQKELEIQKALMKRWLEDNIKDYYIGDNYEQEKETIISSLISLLEEEPMANLQEVYDRLDILKLDGTKKIKDKPDTLADMIRFSFMNSSRWTLADTINVTIGQGANQYTLTQMTNAVASVANGGNLNQLTLIGSIKSPDNKEIIFKKSPSSESIGLTKPESLDYIRKGMHEASYTSLNLPAFEDFPVEVALKTGTGERSGVDPDTQREFAPFAYQVAFAPAEDPKIAIGVVLFQGGSGANCSPITREIVAEYMGLYREKNINKLPIEMDIVP